MRPIESVRFTGYFICVTVRQEDETNIVLNYLPEDACVLHQSSGMWVWPQV